MEEYLASFFSYDSEVLEEIDVNSLYRDDVQPQVEREIGKLLSFLVRVSKSKRVLELGTSVGYSTIWLAGAVKENGGLVTTIDKHILTQNEARANVNRADLANFVEFKSGQIEDILPTIDEKFDFIFQDSGKSFYPKLHNDLVEMLNPGGILVVDDTLFKKFSDVRPVLGEYTDKFCNMVKSDSRLYSLVLPLGKGLTLCIKREIDL